MHFSGLKGKEAGKGREEKKERNKVIMKEWRKQMGKRFIGVGGNEENEWKINKRKMMRGKGMSD